MSLRNMSICILVCSQLFTACDSRLSVIGHFDSKRELSTSEKKLVTTDNAFGIRLFKQISQAQPDSNIFISPLSVSMALSMTANGADGSTREAMRTTLGSQDINEDEINASCKSLIDLLVQLDPDVVFEIANSIWSREGFEVERHFVDLNRKYFYAEIRELDFNLPTAPDSINAWISDRTHGKIDHVLNTISRETMMYVINAIYFLGFWKTQFDPDLTVEGPFTSPGGPLTCHMMHIETAFDYLETETFQAVDMPYGNDQYSMTLLLPKPGYSVDDLTVSITMQDLTNWMSDFSEEDVHLSMPRFKLTYETELKDILTAMGMGIAFDPSLADFTRINPLGGLYISRLLHKTYIEVDEEGTEAAAVTVVELGRTSIEGKIMIVDRPFLFIIREKHSGTILFIGKMVRPQN